MKITEKKSHKMRNFEAHTDDIRQKMLESIGAESVEEFFKVIPKVCRTERLNLETPLSELSAQKKLYGISKKNKTDYISFLGGGAVKKYIPSPINDIASRFEFLSAYTPYQPEISQGTLQIMYEFQTMICNLTNMDVSNASVYDGGSAAAESCLMAVRINKIKNIFISENLNPAYIEVIKTYLWAQDIKYTIGKVPPEDEDFAGVIFQFPEYDGELVKPFEKRKKELLIAVVDVSLLPCLEPPNVDIITGDYQPFGLNLCFGGAYGGFIAVKDAYKRQLPGRIAGRTLDKTGKTAYVLTLQAREQHIRREKATGNICSNQALTALCATLYLSLTGKRALVEYANMGHTIAKSLSDGLDKLGYKTVNKNFFNTFTVEMKSDMTCDEFLYKLKENNILGGIKHKSNKVIITATEFNDSAEVELYLNSLK